MDLRQRQINDACSLREQQPLLPEAGLLLRKLDYCTIRQVKDALIRTVGRLVPTSNPPQCHRSCSERFSKCAVLGDLPKLRFGLSRCGLPEARAQT